MRLLFSARSVPQGLKTVLKAVMPPPIERMVARYNTGRIQRQYAGLPLSLTFDRIYASHAWGGDRSTPVSGPGSRGKYVDVYCRQIAPLLELYHVDSVADLGCGDFHVGRKIATLATNYVGVDISRPVIHANQQAHGSDRVNFVCADLTSDSLPRANAAILRQVLQHLTNAEIRAVLRNVLGTYPLAFITEHIHADAEAAPNIDIPHGPGTRVPLHSGVLVDQPPFDVPAIWTGDIEYAANEVLRTWVVEGKCSCY